MTTFALVHGAWHDSSCWYLLAPELQAMGHDVVAMDLPSDDPSATFADYANVVVQSLRDHGDDIVLVGHSLAGQTIPLVATQRPVRALVYLCALVAVPGRSFVDQLRDEPSMLDAAYERGLEIDDVGRRVWVDADLAMKTFTTTARQGSPRGPWSGCDHNRPRRTSSRVLSRRCLRHLRHTSSAATIAWSIQSGRDVLRGSTWGRRWWSCRVAIRRS